MTSSAIRLVLGLSVLATVVGSAGCSSSSDGGAGGGPMIVPGGAGSSSGGTSGGGGGAGPVSGVPLTPTMGWVDGMSNTLMIQGAYFTYADPTTLPSVMSDTMSSAKICMKGTAAKVDLTCTPVAPATDCYGTFWGAAIGFNLNQPNVVDPTTMMMMGGMPMPFDASAIKGFSFDVEAGSDGTSTIPLPAQFRFNIEDATTQYCTPNAKGVKPGTNTYLFTDVMSKCYATAPGPNATMIQKGVVKISWQVVTVTSATTPFDFCISNVVAIPN